MDCPKAREFLAAYRDGELAQGDRARIAAHLEGCAECAALLETMARIDDAVEAPDPGPRYWEQFQRRLEERIARGEAASPDAVVAQPTRGWARQQLRYLIPAAAAALLAVVIFRNIAPGPAVPVGTAPSRPAEAERVPAPAQEPAPPPARDERETAAKSERPRHAEEKAAADRASRVRKIPEAPVRDATAERPAAPAAPQPAGKAAMGTGEEAAPSGRGAQEAQTSEQAGMTKRQAARAAAPLAAGRAPVDAAGELEEARKKEHERCMEARELAAKDRLREAESAQRECLARDDSAATQENGMVYLAELLDRQGRFAEADAVIAKVQGRYPGSRPLEAYQQRRQQVQGGAVPAR